jgi:hypothetical protein
MMFASRVSKVVLAVVMIVITLHAANAVMYDDFENDTVGGAPNSSRWTNVGCSIVSSGLNGSKGLYCTTASQNVVSNAIQNYLDTTGRYVISYYIKANTTLTWYDAIQNAFKNSGGTICSEYGLAYPVANRFGFLQPAAYFYGSNITTWNGTWDIYNKFQILRVLIDNTPSNPTIEYRFYMNDSVTQVKSNLSVVTTTSCTGSDITRVYFYPTTSDQEVIDNLEVWDYGLYGWNNILTGSVSMKSAIGQRGQYVDLNVSYLTNASNVSAFQFDVNLPPGAIYYNTSTGDAAAAASKDASGAYNATSNSVRVLIFGLNNNTILNGTLAMVRVQIPSNMSMKNTYSVNLSGVLASDANASPVEVISNNGGLNVTDTSFICNDTIYMPGIYTLASDIDGATGTCLDVQASNVTIDCQGRHVNGAPVTGLVKFLTATSRSNITIQYCSVGNLTGTGGSEGGVTFAAVTNVSILHSNISSMSIGAGTYQTVYLKTSSTGARIINSTIAGQQKALSIQTSSTGWLLQDSTFTGNVSTYTAIDANANANSRVTRCTVIGYNGASGYGDSAASVTIENSTFIVYGSGTALGPSGSDMIIFNNITGSTYSLAGTFNAAGARIYNNVLNGPVYMSAQSSTPVVVYNNVFNTSSIQTVGTTYHVQMSNTTSVTNVTPIRGIGTVIGGNYYANFSEACADVNRNRFCDVGFTTGGTDPRVDSFTISMSTACWPNITSPANWTPYWATSANFTVACSAGTPQYDVAVNGVTQIVNTTASNFSLNLSAGNRTVSIPNGSANVTLRMSNLGTMLSVTLDKAIYWIRNEQPNITANATSIDGYGVVTAVLDVFNESTLLATQTGRMTSTSSNFSFNQTVVRSYYNATFVVTMKDELYGLATSNSSASVSEINLDAITLPSNVQPSGVTLFVPDVNVSWTPSVNATGPICYNVTTDWNGTNTTIFATCSDPSVIVTMGETANGRAYVTAYDTYLILPAVGNALPFQIVLNANITSSVCAALTYPNEADQPSQAIVPVNFTVWSPTGFVSPTVWVNLTYGSVTRMGVCAYVVVNATTRAYSCNVSMRYFDTPANYTLAINFSDNGRSVQSVSSGACGYGSLISSIVPSGSVGFPGAGPGLNNVTSDAPMVVYNTGNMPLNISMLGYDLSGQNSPGNKLAASYVRAGPTLGASFAMQNATLVNLSMTVSPGEGANSEVWMWVSMPSTLILQNYVSVLPWQISASG